MLLLLQLTSSVPLHLFGSLPLVHDNVTILQFSLVEQSVLPYKLQSVIHSPSSHIHLLVE